MQNGCNWVESGHSFTWPDSCQLIVRRAERLRRARVRDLLALSLSRGIVMEVSQNLRPGWFKTVCMLAIAWNGFGLLMFLSSVGTFGDPLANLSDSERAAAMSVPDWITASFGTGTITGLIGSIGLFLRKTWATPLLMVSLAALLVLEGWIVLFSGALDMYGLAIPILVTLFAFLLAGLSMKASRNGWLG
jgi:hypothetical protein